VRHSTPLNPGLCDEAPLGLLKSETHAVTAEPLKVSPPVAAIYPIEIIFSELLNQAPITQLCSGISCLFGRKAAQAFL
jgi:hypothetical protein